MNFLNTLVMFLSRFFDLRIQPNRIHDIYTESVGRCVDCHLGD